MSDSGNINECCGHSFGHSRNCNKGEIMSEEFNNEIDEIEDSTEKLAYDEWDKTDPNLCEECGGDVGVDGFCWDCDF